MLHLVQAQAYARFHDMPHLGKGRATKVLTFGPHGSDIMVTHLITLDHICKETQQNYSYDLADHHIEAFHSSTGDMKLHQALHHLVTTLAKAAMLDDMLRDLATLILQITETDVCLILLTEKTHRQLRIHTCVPDLSRSELLIEPIEIDSIVWQHQHNAVAYGHLPLFAAHERETLNPLKNVQYETLLPIPLIVGDEIIGLINCYASTPIQYQNDEQLMLLTIANQAALAIKHRLQVEDDTIAHKTRSKAFIDDLLFGNALAEDTLYRRAHTFGLDLTRPYVVALIEITDRDEFAPAPESREIIHMAEQSRLYEILAEQIRQKVQECYPGSLVTEREGELICLLCLGDHIPVEQLTAWLENVTQQMQAEHHVQITAGIGNICCAINDYRRGYAEAQTAHEMGPSIRHNHGCTHFNALGAYRYIYRFAHTDMLCDQYQEQIAAITDYDRRKKTTLLETLEAYLECGCNIAKAATQLDIHRNTLLQRMERVGKLCTLDLEQVHNRLPLLLAVKVHKLRTRPM